jgi:hypothetical protein
MEIPEVTAGDDISVTGTLYDGDVPISIPSGATLKAGVQNAGTESVQWGKQFTVTSGAGKRRHRDNHLLIEIFFLQATIRYVNSFNL